VPGAERKAAQLNSQDVPNSLLVGVTLRPQGVAVFLPLAGSNRPNSESGGLNYRHEHAGDTGNQEGNGMNVERCALGFNKLITASPVLLFLGAGASAGLGKPTMVQFVEKLKRAIQPDSGRELLHLLALARQADLEKILGES